MFTPDTNLGSAFDTGSSSNTSNGMNFVKLIHSLNQWLRLPCWRRKERTRDRVRQMIHDTLFSDGTGLPSSYSNEEIGHKTETIFGFVYSKSEPQPEPV
jgi:hypothetical protein